MLTIDVGAHEFYDGQKEIFLYTKPHTVRLEHSLISIAKWEAIWKKPYLPSSSVPGLVGYAEELSYISCMIIGKVDDYIPGLLIQSYSDEIREYIDDPHSAGKSHRIGAQPRFRKTVTAELVYYWMIRFGIPSEFDRWHFNRLLVLIDVCNVQELAGQKGGNNLSPLDSSKYRYELNKKRLAKA